jgi:hypothetical protein
MAMPETKINKTTFAKPKKQSIEERIRTAQSGMAMLGAIRLAQDLTKNVGKAQIKEEQEQAIKEHQEKSKIIS